MYAIQIQKDNGGKLKKEYYPKGIIMSMDKALKVWKILQKLSNAIFISPQWYK